jgi:hypothetical protein
MGTWTIRLVNVTLLLAVAALCLACGNVQQAAARSKRMDQIKQIGLLYHECLDANGKAPAGVQDLAKMAQGDPDATAAVALVQSGQVVFIYNVKVTEMTQGASDTVLGYEAGVPAGGGFVLLGDGSVRQMTAAEFQAAPKAQPQTR